MATTLTIVQVVYVDLFAVVILLLGGALACYGSKLSFVLAIGYF